MAIAFRCGNPLCGLELVVSDRSGAREIRCPQCGRVQPVPDVGPRPGPPPEPLLQPRPPRRPLPLGEPLAPLRGFHRDCVAAGGYALKALPRMLVLLLVFTGANALYDLYVNFFSVFAVVVPVFAVLVPLLAGSFLYIMVGFFLLFYLEVAASSLDGLGRAPGIPRVPGGELFELGLKGLGAAVVYVLPVVTLPLLPLGLLGLACCADARGLNVLWAWRAARGNARALGRLWLVLGLWLGLLAAGAVAVRVGVHAAARGLLERPGAALGSELAASAIFTLGAMLTSLWACTFACAAFRCVGLLGRYHPPIVDSLPAEPDPLPVTLRSLGACAAASAAVQCLLWWVLPWVLR